LSATICLEIVETHCSEITSPLGLKQLFASAHLTTDETQASASGLLARPVIFTFEPCSIGLPFGNSDHRRCPLKDTRQVAMLSE